MPFFFIIFGLIVGSFLNAVVYRLKVGKNIAFDRSLCPHCKHTLSAWDLVPVLSFVWLKAKCRYCHKPISWQYPLVETFTALVFFVVGWHFGFHLSEPMFAYLVFCCFFIVIAVYDFKYFLILDKVLLPATVLTVVQKLIEGSNGGNLFGLHSPLVSGIFGVVIISGFFGLQYLVSAGRWIGLGDVKFGLFLGLVFGVGPSVMVLFLAYCLGAIVGLGLITAKKQHLSSKLPFGTFLSFSAIITLIWGPPVIGWYLRLIGL
jgi:prepilin signal peptidase PulO-like enzyme (type II secretory pathway)